MNINSNLNIAGDVAFSGNSIYKGTTTFCNAVISKSSYEQFGESVFRNTTTFSSNINAQGISTFDGLT